MKPGPILTTLSPASKARSSGAQKIPLRELENSEDWRDEAGGNDARRCRCRAFLRAPHSQTAKPSGAGECRTVGDPLTGPVGRRPRRLPSAVARGAARQRSRR